MKVHNEIGSKERFFEMFKNVNKVEVIGEGYEPEKTYFDRFDEVLDQIRNYAEHLGFEIDEDDLFAWHTGGVNYETTKSGVFDLYQKGEQILNKKTQKALNRSLSVSVYRMPSGKYELVMYKTW